MLVKSAAGDYLTNISKAVYLEAFILCQKEINAKDALIMLVKLTTEVNFIIILHIRFSNKSAL